MKILQISNYYNPHIGGIEQTSHDISDSLKKMNDIIDEAIDKLQGKMVE